MSDARDEAPRPRVVMMEADDEAGGSPMSTPQVIATEQSGRVVAAAPAIARPVSTAIDRARRPSRTVRLGLAGLAAGFVGWLGIDAWLWIASVFERSTALGWLAAAAVVQGHQVQVRSVTQLPAAELAVGDDREARIAQASVLDALGPAVARHELAPGDLQGLADHLLRGPG